MTDREIIAEFILQSIKEGDLVKIFLKADRVVTGYVMDKDVFTVNFNESLRDAITRYTTGSNPVRKSKITIEELKQTNDLQEEIKAGMFLNFNLLRNPTSTFLVEDVAAIKKVDDSDK
jgi:hypothetical protein